MWEGQAFDVSARGYEVVDGTVKAILAEYDIPSGLKPVEPSALPQSESSSPPILTDFPQRTASERMRKITKL
ncbi:hypothetical protein BJX63DRAFT_380312, partial [Aspergillus granulosus]